jgi:effector-binding domain-containing protein
MISSIQHPVHLPATRVAAVHVEIPVTNIAPFMDAAIQELLSTVQASGVPITGDLLSYHRRRPTDTFDCEVAIPIGASIEPQGRVREITLPAAAFVSVTLTGPYEELPQAWAAFTDAVRDAGLVTDDVFLERYSRDNTPDTDPATYQTFLYKRLA